jgi:hypothetical protein
MINSKKCGENLMQSSTTTLSFTASPTGEGKWYATREYHALNCLVEEITLKKNPDEHLIESPFGLLNATQQDKQITYNHNTIVWGEITSNTSSSIPIFSGQAYLELTQTNENNNISRLVDTQRQVEISFYNTPDRSNSELPSVFKVAGIPQTFLLFPPKTTNELYRIYKNIFIICNNTEKAESDLCKKTLNSKIKWHESNQQKRSIPDEVKFVHSEDEELADENRLYKISYAWGTLTLKDKINRESGDPFNSEETLEKLYMYESPYQNYIVLRTESDFTNNVELQKTEFEHLIDHTIRLKDTTSCMAVDATNTVTFLPPNAMAFTPCFEDIERWIYNEGTNQIISEKYMQCLTAKHVPITSSFYLGLQQCGDNNKLQKWIFQTDNKNPDIIENNPEISIHDMEEWRLEESNALTTTINSPIFGGLVNVNQGKGNIVWDLINWGLLRTKDQTKTKCVTYHGVGEVLTLETCDPNWTRCQGALEKHLTSIDPLINTQTSVANCSGEAKVRQALEYSSDFTIRPFNTNFCIKANSTTLVLEACAETNTIWGTYNHTGQLMATDRSGLKSKAINRKCLTTKSGKLGLGHCHKDRKKQHFSFEYKNPYQPRSLSAAAIIAWHTNETSSLVENNEIPPITKRDNNNKIPSTMTETDTTIA